MGGLRQRCPWRRWKILVSAVVHQWHIFKDWIIFLNNTKEKKNSMQVYWSLGSSCSYSIVLFTNLSLAGGTVCAAGSLVSTTDFSLVELSEEKGGNTLACSLCAECQEVFETVGNRPSFIVFNLYKATIGFIVGATLGFLFALVIVAIGFVVFCRRRFVTALLMGYGRWDRSMELNSLFTCCRLPRKEQTDIHIHSLR